MNDKQHRVFVYGTLKQGQRLHCAIAGGKFVGKAMSSEAMFQMGCVGFPILFAGGEHVVLGEIYDVDDATLDRLDDIELGSGYSRRQVLFRLDDSGVETIAWVYIYDRRPFDPKRFRRVIEPVNGVLDWKPM